MFMAMSMWNNNIFCCQVNQNVEQSVNKKILRMPLTISLDNPLTQTYMVHAALLAIKLLTLSPLAAMTWVNKGVFDNPDIVRRAYLSELKNLAPFWIIGALYVTTNPPTSLGVTLFRLYSISRMLVIMGYATKPLPVFITDLALIVSYFISCYMSIYVIYFYRKALWCLKSNKSLYVRVDGFQFLFSLWFLQRIKGYALRW